MSTIIKDNHTPFESVINYEIVACGGYLKNAINTANNVQNKLE